MRVEQDYGLLVGNGNFTTAHMVVGLSEMLELACYVSWGGKHMRHDDDGDVSGVLVQLCQVH